MVNLIRRDPFDELLRGFFIRPVGLNAGAEAGAEGPDIRVEVRENTESYQVHAELAGVHKEDIQVHVDGSTLTISAERKQEKEVREGERLLRSEFSYGKVSRSFQLGQEVDESQSEARYNNGVLELILPKKTTPQAKRLTIQ